MDSPYAPYTSWKGKELIEKISYYIEENGRFLNLFQTIFHNLNAYTGNIRMLVDMAHSEDDEERFIALKHLRTVSDDLERTIADLSSVVNLKDRQEVVTAPLNLNQFLDKIQSIVNNYGSDSKATFINNVPDDASVQFNPAYLESILLNFCTNAIKYAHSKRFPVIVFNYFTENNKKVLTITDNGLGIDLTKYGDSLFGLYKTFHNHEDAGGFGLYLTKYQIESMKGEVQVESEVGKGTTFKIVFSG